MSDKKRNISVTVVFIAFIFGFMITNIIAPDGEYSFAERRKLTQLPKLSAQSVFDGSYFEKLEKYILDQFVLRDAFRSVKAYAAYYLFQKYDNNDIYIVDGSINKIVYPLNEKSVEHAAKRFNELAQRYFSGKNIYYSVIPDKSHYINTNHPKLDLEKVCGILEQHLEGLTYIDISESLTYIDYYKTDIHWRQEKLPAVAKLLLEGMGREFIGGYIENELFPFYGGYWGSRQLICRRKSLFTLLTILLTVQPFTFMIQIHTAKYIARKNSLGWIRMMYI